jgi:hypothetical protein
VLSVFVDYYGGYFLLRVKWGTGQVITTHAERPRDFGRRIKAELLRAASERGEAAAVKRKVALLAKHRPVPPEVAARVAQGLGDVGGDVYTPSMPAAAYVRGAGSDDAAVALALICLPGLAEEPYWTRSTSLGQSMRIDTPAQDKIEHDTTASTARELPSVVRPSALGTQLPETAGTHASALPALLDAAPEPIHDARFRTGRSQDAIPEFEIPAPSSSKSYAGGQDRSAGEPAGDPEDCVLPRGEQSGPRPVLLGEIRVHSLEHARSLPDAELRARVDAALKGVDEQSRRVVAEAVGKLLGATSHPADCHVGEPGTGGHGGHGPKEQQKEWAEALLQGLRIGRDDALVHIKFSPSKAPSTEELRPVPSHDPAVTDGTSKFVEVSNSGEKRSDLINIGVGVVLETFVYESTKHVGVGLDVHFIPRKQLEVSHGQQVTYLDGSRLMDGPRGTYSTGTDVTVVIQKTDGSQVTGVVHVPEHDVEYSVMSSLAKPAEAGNTEIRHIVAPERLLDHPFGLTKIDPEPVLRAIGGALLSAGYTGHDAAHVVHEVAEEVFNSDQAQLVNHSLFDSTYRSDLIEGHHFLGNVQIALELVSVRRAPDITGDDAPPLRMDVAYAVETSHERSHGYDVRCPRPPTSSGASRPNAPGQRGSPTIWSPRTPTRGRSAVPGAGDPATGW